MYSVTFKWKEVVIYSEDGCTFWFPAGWGVDPPVLYIPSDDLWERVTPSCMHGRRDVIVERLQADSKHVLKELDRLFEHRSRDE
ncbi:hypothetical protein Pth03_43850 [Planotetraspora thailandica]|uniref:Uncharacterized protein n=1 Tax=Planotetraspora thailandica TaxID=487172 RepID=A0A8J3V6T3_9ACTN|nr:hypothetical protein [Planotetraspora thailandica]GII55996.1 hypothetical protein Pth03_43850 [Planotetraspora thailandica]